MKGLSGVSLRLVRHMDDANELISWMGQSRPVLAIDTETTGFDPYEKDAEIRLLQVGDAMTGWAIPYKRWYGLIHDILTAYDGPTVAHNCFSGDTNFLTRNGVTTLRAASGKHVEVWTRGGWAPATVRSFGKQRVQRIVLAPKGRRTTITRTVVATPDHRWELENGTLTTDLQVGDVVPEELPQFSVDMQTDGFRHGLIYGDGTLIKNRSRPGDFKHQIRLCGAKSQFASSFDHVTHPASYGGDPQAYFTSSTHMKQLPVDGTSAEYLHNFIAGWLATDGSFNSTRNSRQLSTTRAHDIDWLQGHASEAGYTIVGSTSEPINTKYSAATTTTSYKITLAMPTNQGRRFRGWRVKSIEKLKNSREVFCAVVPDVERFTLDGGIYTSNCAFEQRWLYRHADWQIPRRQFNDTMLMAHIIDPLGSGALKSLANKYVDPRASAGQHLLEEAFNEHKWTWATVPLDFDPYWSYSALDCVLTARLHELFMEKCAPGAVYGDVYDIEINTRHIISRMERTGALIDVEYAEATYEKLSRYAQSIRDWGKDVYGISIGSPGQLAKQFLSMGAEITEKTPGGSPKMDKHQLEVFTSHPARNIRELAQQVLAMRKAGKYAETYFKNLSEKADDNGVVHADIRTLGARTSRMSIGSPALQQLPKGEALVRDAFIAHPGNKLVTADFNQIEMRLLAHSSRDPDLIKTFRESDETGGDFFVGVGRDIYGDPTFNKVDKRRALVKSSMYGLAYGAGVAKMAATAGVPEPAMRAVVDGLHAQYPGIREFIREVENIGVKRERSEGQGYIITDTGRRLPCDVGKAYTLVNYSLQGAAAEIFKKGLIRLDLAGYGDAMILPVHDEIVLDLPENEVYGAMREVPEIMADLDFDVALSAEAEGPFDRWGEKYSK